MVKFATGTNKAGKKANNTLYISRKRNENKISCVREDIEIPQNTQSLATIYEEIQDLPTKSWFDTVSFTERASLHSFALLS